MLYMVAPLLEKPRKYLPQLKLEENIVAVITQDRVTDDNLKRKIKIRTSCTCRLLLLT